MDQDFDRLLIEAERRAERLIALLRIGTAVALVAIYGFVVTGRVPERLMPDLAGQLELARVTMLAYAFLGVVALMMTTKARHRRWHAYAFVTADAAFVALSLYASLATHAVSGHYATAMPGVWLAPLVLSFNTLRFSWRVQAHAGAVMIAGLAIVGSRPGPGRDGTLPETLYTAFGDPPNVMRLAMLALACVVITVGVMRTRALLRTGLDEARRRALLTSYMPRQVARLIEERGNEVLRAGYTLRVIVMFVDIRDFTARAETMPPERVSAFLGEYRRLLRVAADEAGGIVDKFVGDGAMIVIGPGADAATAPARAVRCARVITARIAAWSASLEEAGRRPVRIGIGVHMGEAFVGAVGDEERLEFTVVGDVVNTAARMEEAAKAVQADIVVSEEVLAAAGLVDDPDWVPLPDATVRGRLALVPARAFHGPCGPVAPL